MSLLEEISIQGIRSYHPHEKQTLKFQKPLTLILGQNGCGKTTIIECLKYVTCSDQPKNTKNGGFVWDPKLSEHTSVKGNVKLSFRDTKDIHVVVSKTLESTQKLKTITTKSLDQTVTRKGENYSHKCANVDDVMCTYLGVSKPILKDVVFCHQEDSSWPLDEDKKLKEKFDSIFDVGKYDKCIGQVCKEMKTIHEEQKITKNNLIHLKTYREEARNKRAMLDNKIMKKNQLETSINQMEENMKPLEKRYNDILYIEENLSTLKTELSTSEGHLRSIRLAQKELKSVIKSEFIGNDSDLDEELMNFETNLLQKEKEKNRKIQEKNNAFDNEKKIQESISKQQVNLGRYQSEEKQNQNNVTKQIKKITDLANYLQLSLPDITELNRLEIQENLSKKLNSMNINLESTLKEHSKIEKEIQSDIDSVRVEKAKLDQEIKIKEKQIIENSTEIDVLKKDIEQVKNSTEKLAKLQQLKFDNETETKKLKTSFNSDMTKIELNKKEEEKEKLNLKLEALEKEVHKLQSLNVEQSELDKIVTVKSGTENKLKILKNKVSSILIDLLGEVPEENIKYKFTSFLDKLITTIKLNRKNIAEKQKQLTTLEANYNHTKEKLRTKQRDLSDDENALSDMCQGQEYETLLKEVNEKVEELQEQKGSVSTSGHLFRRYIKNLEAQDPSCPLCHRGFDSIEDVTQLISDLNLRVQKIPNELETTVSQLETLLEKQSKLQQLKPTYTRRSLLNDTEIPKLKIELKNMENDLNKYRNELAKLSSENGKLETDETNAKNIQSEIVMIDSYINDIKGYKKEEQQLVTKISKYGAIRSLKEAIDEQKILKNILNDTSSIIQKMQTELNEFNTKMWTLKIQLSQITCDELNVKTNMQDEKGVVAKLNDLQNLELTLSLQLDNAREAIGPIQEKLDTFIHNFEQTKKQQSRKIENIRKEVRIFETKLEEIKNLQLSIIEYERKENTQSIKATNQLLDGLTKDKMHLVESQINIQKEIDSINEYNANQEIKKMNLENNKKLRQKLKEENECLLEVNKLKENVGNMDVNSLVQEKRNISEKLGSLHKEKNQSLGGKQELDNIITNIKKELNAGHYREAENNYLHDKVQLEILNRVYSDLMKYNKALEWSLNRFHTEHMHSINSIIKNLWVDIYKGNDIDYIQIKTTDDNKQLNTETSKRRVYNYRVVQVKNGIEIDMRGRCSAGQKVLACLIVRMALAETFSKQCGILALDEPTTNLDETNIQSLAESLSEIVTRRSSQKSFQLIIITHDPNFLRRLSARDMVDTYYEVTRSNNGTFSVVQEKDIRLLY